MLKGTVPYDSLLRSALQGRPPEPFRVIGAGARQGGRDCSCNSKRVFIFHFCDPPELFSANILEVEVSRLFFGKNFSRGVRARRK